MGHAKDAIPTLQQRPPAPHRGQPPRRGPPLCRTGRGGTAPSPGPSGHPGTEPTTLRAGGGLEGVHRQPPAARDPRRPPCPRPASPEWPLGSAHGSGLPAGPGRGGGTSPRGLGRASRPGARACHHHPVVGGSRPSARGKTGPTARRLADRGVVGEEAEGGRGRPRCFLRPARSAPRPSANYLLKKTR